MNIRPLLVTLAASALVASCATLQESVPTDSVIVETSEIIQILEEEDIEMISTFHSQWIHIVLKNGSVYAGKYVQSAAGSYSSIPQLWDVLNLVRYIEGKRSRVEPIAWDIGMQ